MASVRLGAFWLLLHVGVGFGFGSGFGSDFEAESAFRVSTFKAIRDAGVVRQQYEESCGAASLATLMNLYGRRYSEKTLLNEVNTTDMASFTELQKTAMRYGFRAAGYRLSPEIFETLQFPIIARIIRHRNYPHFVVVKNLPGDFVQTLDPSAGNQLLHKRDFFSVWHESDRGYALVILPQTLRQPSIPKTMGQKGLGF